MTILGTLRQGQQVPQPPAAGAGRLAARNDDQAPILAVPGEHETLEAMAGGSHKPLATEAGAADAVARLQSDAALLRAVYENVPDAFDRLHARFAVQINRIVWRTLGDLVEHDDVVQDVMVAIVEGAHRVKNPRALEAWVIQLTLNKVRSVIRARIRRRRDAGHEAALGGRTWDAHEARRILRRCSEIVSRFPEKECRAFLLCRIDGRELAEAATLCDCGLSTMKRWLARADKRFQQRISKDPIIASWFRDGGVFRGGQEDA